ncbi:MAG TPA: acyltransferase [Nocardioidaceae bacterium]|nr:acyltransferase [Nocardioidaceae bacterium]
MTERIAGIDALRGVAVGLVMLRHAFPDLLPGAGVVGVVMFFALSGHLITGLLLDELAGAGRLDLRRFYLRRARRLVPALLALVATVVVVTLVFDPLGDRDQLLRTTVVALTWTGDLPFEHGGEATFHLWTLAMEEQFYLVWPLVLTAAFTRRLVFSAFAASAALCFLAAVATSIWLREEPDLAYTLPTSWAICFVIGGASALVARRGVPVAGAGPALLALLVLCAVPLRGQATTYLVAAPAIALLACVVLLSWREWRTVDHPLLKGLVLLGTVSYAAYLWNYPLSLWVGGLAAIPLTLVAAALSWRYVEEPVRQRVRLPDRVSLRP